MEKSKRNILVLCISIGCIVGITFLAGYVMNISEMWLKIAILVSLNLMNGLVALIAMRLTNMKIDIHFKKKQLLIGAMIALVLSLIIAIIPAIFGFSMIGSHRDFSWFSLIYSLLFFLLVIGPVEEFVFRVYLQDVCVGFFQKREWVGVVSASFIFGLWHIINGNVAQAIFTFLIGLVFGFSKHKIKDCGYIGVAFGHGLYDFLNVLVTMFILK